MRLRHLALVAGAFVAMEGVAYAAHRWVMHGPGRGWHESHHGDRLGRFERNDLYPATFAGLTVAAMALGTADPRRRGAVLSLGAGVAAYGTAYLLVHDGVIHRRFPTGGDGRPARYRTWVARSHGLHHADRGEPFGMLLPVTAARRRRQDPQPASEPVGRS